MAKNTNAGRVSFKISLEADSCFNEPMAGAVFDNTGNLIAQKEITKGQLSLSLPAEKLARSRVFITPLPEEINIKTLTLDMMERFNAFEPQVLIRGKLIEEILIPGHIIDIWPFCLCWVRGRVIKSDSSGPVCGAKVHICEVDKFWRWIVKLPELEIFKLRDDLIRVIEEPHIHFPPKPQPDPPPFDFIGENIRLTNFQPVQKRFMSKKRINLPTE